MLQSGKDWRNKRKLEGKGWLQTYMQYLHNSKQKQDIPINIYIIQYTESKPLIICHLEISDKYPIYLILIVLWGFVDWGFGFFSIPSS